jgi:transposase
VVDVEQWAEIRRLFFVRGLSQREIHRRTGLHRDTIRNAINSERPPKYERASAGSKLDRFKDEIHRLLKADPRMPGQRVRELITPLGFDGGKTIVDDYLRQVRPLFDPPRTFQRTIYRPGEICQFDLWEPAREIPVGHGQFRRGWVVIACLGYSRAGAGALIFSKEIPDLLFGIRRCLWRLGALPETLVWDRQAGLHAGGGGRPTEAFAAFCGQLRVDWHFCDAGDPQAKGVVERLQDFAERSFEPGRIVANELDYQTQLDAWFDERANPRMHKTLRCRPIDRLLEERQLMAPLPMAPPDVDRRWVLRVAPDPYLRFDTNDYSLDPALVGRRVEARITDREVLAVALDTGELACRHARSFARHRTVTALEHARALKHQRHERRGSAEPHVEIRSLASYDALIA